MKKIYVLLIALMFTASFNYAQQVELMGTGMHQNNIEELPVLDDANLVDVTLFAVYLRSDETPPASTVTLYDNSESYPIPFTQIPSALNFGDVPDAGLGYFTKVFDDEVDANGEIVDASAINTNFLYSFYAFIKRDDPDADYYSVFDYTHVHCWANGPDNTYTYELELLDGGTNRQVRLKMPFSGLQNNLTNLNRVAVVEVSGAGMTTETYTFTGNNGGGNFTNFYHEFTSPQFEVPASTSKIYVKVYSPTDPKDAANDDLRPIGDSFMCGGVVADVKDVPDGPNCTYTQGYWKTHSIYGPAGPADPTWDLLVPSGPDNPFFLSGDTWYNVFWTAPKGNPYYSLAHQWMAAHLNFLGGADPTDAQTAYDEAKILFETYTPADVAGDKDLKKEFKSYIDILTDYNEGEIGPGHCDDGEEEEEKSAFIGSTGQDLNVYPNPVSTGGTIDFKAAESGQTTIEVYNMMGAKVATLFDQPVQNGEKIQVRFDVSDYTKGLYVIYIRNGSDIKKHKITVVK
jgi:hypothetical protein